ncbi:MAG TPA: hypothetical protein VM600_10645, partial [Actinomycetota bacterium]|nr:hypothetical protein [Actinomycetota bacterium]
MRRILLLVLLAAAAIAPHARASTSYDVSYLAPPRPVCCGNGVSLEGDVLIMNHAALDAISRIDV